MVEQKVSIPIMDLNDENLGILTVSAVFNNQLVDACIYNDDITLENVPRVEQPDSETPIQCHCGTDINLSPLMLLEETRYQVFFDSSDNIGSDSKLRLLPTIRRDQKSNFIFEPLRIPSKDNEKQEFGGYLNFHSYAGKSFIDVEINGIKSKPYCLEVRSKKIGYHEHYPAMIGDLSEAASGILFEIDAPLYQDFELSEHLKETYYEYFMFLEYLFLSKNLPLTYDYILRNMYSRLEKYVETVPATFASDIGPSEMIDIISNPDNLHESKNPPNNWPSNLKNYVPDAISQKFYQETIDTPENRFLKYFIELLDKLIHDMIEHFKNEDDGYIKSKLNEYQTIVQDYLSDRWTREVGKLQYLPLNSQVIQKREGYRDIFKYYINFEFAFRLEWEEIEENIKGYERKLSELYEYWCYFKLIRVMGKITHKKINYEDIYDVDNNKWSIKVKKGSNSVQKFELEFKGYKIKLYLMYNRLFSKRYSKYHSYSLPFRPDYTLQIDFNGNQYFVHFDAKYRSEGSILDFYEKIGCEKIVPKKDLSDEDLKKREENYIRKRDNEEINTKEYKDGDLYKMHTYKDAILKTEGAYVFYPGNKCEVFRVNERETIPSVGAFPLTPGESELEEDNLIKFIKSILRNIIKRTG
ncbi:DUF2357 domain-containing protein [Methanobacterium sp.]|uniref:DUF2357 domain-containing protein n=1 Tax=Methanobacterium sp. TaxID=2164 RepID=UPI003C7508FF